MVVVRGPDPRLGEPEGAAAVARAIVAECARQVREGVPTRAHVVSLTIGLHGVALRLHLLMNGPYSRNLVLEQARVVFSAVVARALEVG